MAAASFELAACYAGWRTSARQRSWRPVELAATAPATIGWRTFAWPRCPVELAATAPTAIGWRAVAWSRSRCPVELAVDAVTGWRFAAPAVELAVDAVTGWRIAAPTPGVSATPGRPAPSRSVVDASTPVHTDPIDEVTQVRLAPIRPSGGWYVLGVALIAGGLLGAFAVLMVGAVGHIQALDELERFDPPGQATVVVEPGRYRIYHEPRGAEVASLAALGITVRSADTPGDELPVAAAAEPDRYRFEGRRGVEVGRFEVVRAGTFLVVVDGEVTGSIAVGPGPTRELTAVGSVALALAAIGSVSGTAVLVVVRRRRRRSHEQRRLAALGRG